MTSLYKILKSAKLGAGAAQDFHTAIMAQKMPFAKRSGAEHEYTGAVPVTFTADGTPLLDYLINGNTVQSGTPTPDNPIMPEGTGDRTENLLDNNPLTQGDGYADNALLIENGTLQYNTAFWVTEYISITEGTYYYYNDISRVSYAFINFYNSNKTRIGSVKQKFLQAQEEFNLTELVVPQGTSYIRMTIDKQSTLNCLYDIQLSSYILYGYKIPISSAGQTMPIYLGEVETTRRIKKLVLTGGQHDGDIGITPRGIIYITPLRTLKNVGDAYCTHYKYVNQNQGIDMPYNSFTTRGGDDTSLWFKTEYATIADFKDYLADQYANGTPVTVWYVLATEETGIVNEPLMRIGNYADTLSHAQAGVSIPTANGSTTLDVETAVKPSEIYIKYKS